MENQQSSLLSWVYQYQGKATEELCHSLLYTTLELEQTRMAVQEELKVREDQLIQLRDLLNKAMKERDEAQERCRRLVLEKNLLLRQQQWRQQQMQEQVVVSVNDEEQDRPRRGNDSNNNGLSSSDGEESIVSTCEHPKQSQQPPLMQQCSSMAPGTERIELMFPERPLPEKGKLLQAVMKAGPLLKTLLLAGPLPQWRHPPPLLESFEIPPVITPPAPKLHLVQYDLSTEKTCGNLNRKRVLCNESNSPRETKHQRIVLP